jgi:hypothetical protein
MYYYTLALWHVDVEVRYFHPVLVSEKIKNEWDLNTVLTLLTVPIEYLPKA